MRYAYRQVPSGSVQYYSCMGTYISTEYSTRKDCVSARKAGPRALRCSTVLVPVPVLAVLAESTQC